MSVLKSNGPATYRVVGARTFRGHQPGEEFDATLDRGAEKRGIDRGDIAVVARRPPSVQPGSYRLPHGWVQPHEGGQ